MSTKGGLFTFFDSSKKISQKKTTKKVIWINSLFQVKYVFVIFLRYNYLYSIKKYVFFLVVMSFFFETRYGCDKLKIEIIEISNCQKLHLFE